MFSGQLTTPDRFSYHTGRAAADESWTPPAIFDGRCAAAILSAAPMPRWCF